MLPFGGASASLPHQILETDRECTGTVEPRKIALQGRPQGTNKRIGVTADDQGAKPVLVVFKHLGEVCVQPMPAQPHRVVQARQNDVARVSGDEDTAYLRS